jgi:hypothetical protein
MKKKTTIPTPQQKSWLRSEDDGRMVSSSTDDAAAADPELLLKVAHAERDAAKLDAERYKNELNRVNRERALERASLTDELASSAERVSRQRSEIERLKEKEIIAASSSSQISYYWMVFVAR